MWRRSLGVSYAIPASPIRWGTVWFVIIQRPRSGTLNRNDYFETGLDLLAEGGIPAQTIANLCERLGITKGSFYHHFKSLGDFRQQLLAFWEAGQETALGATSIEASAEWVTPANHPINAAVRAWAQSDESAAAAQGRVDALRLKVVSKELRAVGLAADRARALANLGLAILIGAQQAGAGWDRKTRRGLVEEYERAVGAAVAEAQSAKPVKPAARKKA